MPEQYIDAFKCGAMEVWQYEEHQSFDDTRLEALGGAIKGLRDVCHKPTEHLRLAFQHLYPDMQLTYDNLTRELDEELALVARIRQKQRLSALEFNRLRNFCSEMWVQLRMQENGATPFVSSLKS